MNAIHNRAFERVEFVMYLGRMNWLEDVQKKEKDYIQTDYHTECPQQISKPFNTSRLSIAVDIVGRFSI